MLRSIHPLSVGKYLHAFIAQSMTLLHCSYLVLEHGGLMASLQGIAPNFATAKLCICNKHLAAFGLGEGGLAETSGCIALCLKKPSDEAIPALPPAIS